MFSDIAGGHAICPEVHYLVPEFGSLAAGDWINRIPRAPADLGPGFYNPIECPGVAYAQVQSPPGNVITLRTAKLQHRDTSRLTVPFLTPWHGHTRPLSIPSRTMTTYGWRCCPNASTSAPTSTIHYCRPKQGPTDHTRWRNALINVFETTCTRDPSVSLIHPMRAKQEADTYRQVSLDGLRLLTGRSHGWDSKACSMDQCSARAAQIIQEHHKPAGVHFGEHTRHPREIAYLAVSNG